ncbi:MAG: DNA polymerase IV, partial [Kordiimonas sp.]
TISHPELLSLSIAHLDCDAFYAAIEKRDNPELASRPVLIGGEQRGVVSTACYIARMSGVHSAMPMYKAKKLCPDAVIIRGNMKLYQEVGRDIRERMRALTPVVEPLSIDEAFLDLSGTEKLHKAKPATLLARFAKEIEDEIGITVSVGLAPNKFLAKLGSDMDKPRGFTVIGNSDAKALLATLPISRIYGIGKKSAQSLAKDGLSQISQLQTMDEASLIRRYGETGQRLYRLSRGIDKRTVKPGSGAKSVSSERTLAKDLADYTALETLLWGLCETVSADLKRKELAGSTITVKLKTSMHRIVTRSRTIDTPTQLAENMFEVGKALLEPLADGTPYRLIGIGMSQFRPLREADQADLLEPKRTKKANAERAMDALKGKFGKTAISKGRNFKAAENASTTSQEKK